MPGGQSIATKKKDGTSLSFYFLIHKRGDERAILPPSGLLRGSNDRTEGNDKCWTHVRLTIPLSAVSADFDCIPTVGKALGPTGKSPD